MRVRNRRFRSGGQGFPPPHDMVRGPHPRHPMLPSGPALIAALVRTDVVGGDVRSVVGCQPTGSALRDIESSDFVSARCSLLWPLLTSQGISSLGSPQVRTRCVPTRPLHLPPRLNQWVSLCGASSSHRVGLLCGSCSLAHRFPLACLPPVGYPSGVGFEW